MAVLLLVVSLSRGLLVADDLCDDKGVESLPVFGCGAAFFFGAAAAAAVDFVEDGGDAAAIGGGLDAEEHCSNHSMAADNGIETRLSAASTADAMLFVAMNTSSSPVTDDDAVLIVSRSSLAA